MKFENERKINGNYFIIIKTQRGKIENLNDFNINYNEYVIIKASNKPRIVSVEDFLDFKYSEYLFIRKDIFNEDDFNFWMKKPLNIRFLHQPLQPKSLYEKIIIMK